MFRGAFDGNGYKITGLKINRPDEDYIGLFGLASFESYISNLNIENAFVNGNNRVGIVACRSDTISNCISTGQITGKNNTGGILGVKRSAANPQITIENSSYNSGITSTSKYVGNLDLSQYTAAATLLLTANQSPSIALQLI